MTQFCYFINEAVRFAQM